ncbi:MAG TPA: hypothetical protein VM871_05890 [Flavisolibacter sp.]|jgi:hypothetical protein|nr:hypothetical protein [Flavisolibacter sp.]
MTDRLYTTTTEIEKARALWENGVLLAERTDGFYKTKLYQLHDVYLEVVWHNHFNVVVKVCHFTDTDHLAPYLKDISLDELFT